MKKTALYSVHENLGAKIVEFAGYLMPIQYSSILQEHKTVRNSVGVFDVSHMGEFFIKGKDALNLVQLVTINDASKLTNGRVQYSAMCYPDGGIVDDLLVYKLADDELMLVVNATNKDKDLAWIKGGFFNFAIKDGITISDNNPFKVVVNVKSQGYLDATFPVILKFKGTQGVTFFLAKPQDFSEDVNVNTFSTGDAGNNGTVKDTVTTKADDGTEVTISEGTTLTDSEGDPLQGNLTTNVTTIVYDETNSSIQPPNTNVGNNQAIAPLMSLNVVVSDEHGNTAENLSQPILTSIPVQEPLVNPTTGSQLQAGDSIPIWYLNNSGNYVRSYPSAYLSNTRLNLRKSSKANVELTLHAYIQFANSLLGYTAPLSTPKFQISNPRAGYSLQVFLGIGNFYAPIAYSGQVNGTVITLPEDNYPQTNYSVIFKYGANPVDASGGYTFAETQWNTSNTNPLSVTFNYPAESIQASVKITGVCTSRDPIVRTYPSITFNYRKKGTDTWQQGTLTNGEATIAGLDANSTYEAKATYRDKEATVDIIVNTATDFIISAGQNQGNLLRAEIMGTSQIDDVTYVNLEIDIDLKDDCD